VAHRQVVIAVAVSVALFAATLSPLARAPHADAFPLSTYPMFAMERPTKLTLTYAIATGATRHEIAPEIVGSAEPLQAMMILDKAVHTATTAQALCETIAGRIATISAFDDANAVVIVTGTHDAVDYLVRHVRGVETERARCTVKR
jgi:hypothetical protein